MIRRLQIGPVGCATRLQSAYHLKSKRNLRSSGFQYRIGSCKLNNNVDFISVIPSWPVKHFCSTRNRRVQELEINERTVRTSQGSTKLLCLLVLNSIIWFLWMKGSVKLCNSCGCISTIMRHLKLLTILLPGTGD